MLCQNCNQQNATTHIHSVINGVVRDKYLCNECAGKYKSDGFENNDFLKMLSSFFQNEQNNNRSNNIQKCSLCGCSFEEIYKTGKLGCAECYNTFRKQLEPTVLKLHGNLKHVGKTPDNETKNYDIDILKQRLQNAIKIEDFETAAFIRDKIKEMGE